jgi:hypothetical protein
LPGEIGARLDGIAEAAESGDEAIGLGGFGAPVEVSRTQILVEGVSI